MTAPDRTRRNFLIRAGLGSAVLLTSPVSLITPLHAQSVLAPTSSMRGGSNNYAPVFWSPALCEKQVAVSRLPMFESRSGRRQRVVESVSPATTAAS